MRIFALYLPQFHQTDENDLWWGKGFTEWTNVRKAKPLYRGHVQPIAPVDGKYYNLLDKETVEKQTFLMQKYGITGMIYYHYYFLGKKLLNKPAENLLKWTDIEQPFFFCWANHTWNRSWKGSREVLIEQGYGTEKDWRDHFDYLLPFFRDSRYEKRDNKPVFMLYQDFPEKKAVFDCFNNWCKESGFNGIYVIEECFTSEIKGIEQKISNMSAQTEKLYITQPLAGNNLVYGSTGIIKRVGNSLMHKLRQRGILKTVRILNGDRIYKTMLQRTPRDKKFIHGLFFEWDNTPRHGTRGYIIKPPQKETFIAFAKTLVEDEYVIVNAWNEWAEGMVLEPTVHNGYKYLEWIYEITQLKKLKEN